MMIMTNDTTTICQTIIVCVVLFILGILFYYAIESNNNKTEYQVCIEHCPTMNGKFQDYECLLMCGITNNNINITQYYDILENIKCNINEEG